MSHAEPAVRPPWTERLYAPLPLPPWAVGVLVAGALVALLTALAAASGGLAELDARGLHWWQHRDGRLTVLLALLLGATPTALRYHELGTRRNLDALSGEDLWQGEPPPELVRDPARRSQALGFALCGLLALPVISLSVDRDPRLYFGGDYWGFAQVWIWVMGSGVLFLGGLLVYRVWVDARRFAALARALPRVDLLDREPLLPFTRQGLRSAVPGLLALTFLALNLGDEDFWIAIGLVGAVTFAQNVGMLLIPLWSLRQRLAQAKREELARVHAALRGELGALRGSPIGGREAPGLADLLAWRRFVESAPEWPIDPSTAGRFALYLGIPLLSWVGAALVERVLDSVIG